MKKFWVCTILPIGIFCALLSFSPLKANADTIGSTVTLQLTGVQGASYGNDYVYPYYLSVNGASPSFSMMCISYDNDIYFGESWTATITAVSGQLQEEAVWLFNDANAAIAAGNTAKQIADQWAAWELFSTNAQNATAPAGAATQLALAEAAYGSEPTSFYSDFVIYVPVAGSQPSGAPVPQELIGNAPAPEPGTLVLLGTGILGLAGFLYRKRRSA
jgi:Tfp pilus assembly protein PilV